MKLAWGLFIWSGWIVAKPCEPKLFVYSPIDFGRTAPSVAQTDGLLPPDIAAMANDVVISLKEHRSMQRIFDRLGSRHFSLSTRLKSLSPVDRELANHGAYRWAHRTPRNPLLKAPRLEKASGYAMLYDGSVEDLRLQRVASPSGAVDRYLVSTLLAPNVNAGGELIGATTSPAEFRQYSWFKKEGFGDVAATDVVHYKELGAAPLRLRADVAIASRLFLVQGTTSLRLFVEYPTAIESRRIFSDLERALADFVRQPTYDEYIELIFDFLSAQVFHRGNEDIARVFFSALSWQSLHGKFDLPAGAERAALLFGNLDRFRHWLEHGNHE